MTIQRQLNIETKVEYYRTNEECYIDKNYIHRNGDGYTFAKIRTRAI